MIAKVGRRMLAAAGVADVVVVTAGTGLAHGDVPTAGPAGTRSIEFEFGADSGVTMLESGRVRFSTASGISSS